MMQEIALRGRAYPTDLNPAGTVFGGWIMAKMDKAASIAVENIVISGAVTVSVSDLQFLKPIKNGDIFTAYTSIKKIGYSSIVVAVDMRVKHRISNKEYQVTKADFSFVTVKDMKSIPVLEVIREDVCEDVSNMARMCELKYDDDIKFEDTV